MVERLFSLEWSSAILGWGGHLGMGRLVCVCVCLAGCFLVLNVKSQHNQVFLKSLETDSSKRQEAHPPRCWRLHRTFPQHQATYIIPHLVSASGEGTGRNAYICQSGEWPSNRGPPT